MLRYEYSKIIEFKLFILKKLKVMKLFNIKKLHYFQFFQKNNLQWLFILSYIPIKDYSEIRREIFTSIFLKKVFCLVYLFFFSLKHRNFYQSNFLTLNSKNMYILSSLSFKELSNFNL